MSTEVVIRARWELSEVSEGSSGVVGGNQGSLGASAEALIESIRGQWGQQRALRMIGQTSR